MERFAPEVNTGKLGLRAPGLTLASESAAVKTEVKKAASFSNSAPCAGATTVWKGRLSGSPSRRRAESGCSTHASPSSVRGGSTVYEPERGRISESTQGTLPWLASNEASPPKPDTETSYSLECSKIVEPGESAGWLSTLFIKARSPR